MRSLATRWLCVVILLATTFQFRSSALNLRKWRPQTWRGPPPISPFSREWPNTVAICAMMKDEHFDDIDEWLAYHKWIGVDKILLWEDSEAISRELRALVQPWINTGFVELHALNNTSVLYTNMQIRLYNRCSKPDMGGAFSWVMNIDLDEFLVIMDEGKASTHPNLKEVLTAFRNNAGIALQAIMFGSSGHVQRPSPGGPLRYYTNCGSYVGTTFKNLANTYWLKGMSIHNSFYRYEDDPLAHPVVRSHGAPLTIHVVDEANNKSTLDHMVPDRTPGEPLRTHHWQISNEFHNGRVFPGHRLLLLHYVTRSQEDYIGRKFRITQAEFERRGETFGTSMFDNPGKAGIAKFDEAWFKRMQEERFRVSFGICTAAADAHYADAAQQVIRKVKGG